MEIKHCSRCGLDWCYRGTGKPVRCGKCKSPYWEVGHGGPRKTVPVDRLGAASLGNRPSGESGNGRPAVEPSSGPGEPDEERCGYREWSGDYGEFVTCKLPKHGPKVKHGNWKTE